MKNIEQSRRNFLKVLAGTSASLALAGELHGMDAGTSPAAAGTAIKPLEKIRAAFIGVGARGSGHVATMMSLDGVEIVAIADNHEPSLKASVARVKNAGRKEPAAFGRGDEDYKRMLQRDDIDIVIIATPWEWHTRMCVDAMTAGKHAFTEVPAAVTLDECWQLVDTAEKTHKHCMMMENCCYGREELFCLNLCRQGLLGELLHGEAAYLHDLRGQMNEVKHGTGSWRTWHYAKRNGNLYPTHGLGPVAQYMGINRGDRFDYLSSVSSPALGRPAFAKAHFPPDHQWNKVAKWNCGDMCTTIVKTALGRTIMVQWNETSPRPYSRINLIQGTRRNFRRLSVAIGDRRRHPQWGELDGRRQARRDHEEVRAPVVEEDGRIGQERRRSRRHGLADGLADSSIACTAASRWTRTSTTPPPGRRSGP